MEYRNQHGKVIKLVNGIKAISRDSAKKSCENYVGLYHNHDDTPLCSISTFGHDSTFEIDIVDENGNQTVYTADELLEALADFSALCSKVRGL